MIEHFPFDSTYRSVENSDNIQKFVEIVTKKFGKKKYFGSMLKRVGNQKKACQR